MDSRRVVCMHTIPLLSARCVGARAAATATASSRDSRLCLRTMCRWVHGHMPCRCHMKSIENCVHVGPPAHAWAHLHMLACHMITMVWCVQVCPPAPALPLPHAVPLPPALSSPPALSWPQSGKELSPSIFLCVCGGGGSTLHSNCNHLVTFPSIKTKEY